MKGVATQSDPSKSPPTSKRATKNASQLTPEQCMAFMDNARKDPVTSKRIVPGSATYNKFVNQCVRVLGDDMVPVIVASNVLKSNPSATERRANHEACVRMVNDSLDFSVSHHQTTVIDPLSKGKRMYPISAASAKRLLETCHDTFGVVLIHILVRDQRFQLNIPVYIHIDNGTEIRNPTDIREALSEWIDKATVNVPREEIFDAVIASVEQLINSRLLNSGTAMMLEDILMELQAMKMGINMSRDDAESSSSSSMNTANRSRSKSVPSGLAPLPSKTRKEILEDLERTCIDMMDMITLDDFNDMKKKKLQLIVGIGPKNKEGQQRCYHVKSVYNFIKSAVKQGLVPREPMSKEPITTAEIHDVILPKMRYIKPDARDPGHVQKKKYPVLELHIRNVIRTNTKEPFFEINLVRIIGRLVFWRRKIGYIPANIETESADLNSYAVIAKIRDLFDNGRLVDQRMQIRAHLNKSIVYWDTDRERKLAQMVNELSHL